MLNEISIKVKNIISRILEVDMEVIRDDLAIGDIKEWDSLHHIQIISEIEEEFGIKFTPDIMIELEDVEDIIVATSNRI